MAEEELNTDHMTRDLLSIHHTIAQFKGKTHRPCRFLTSLCPNQCSHAADYLDFDIIKYFKYDKPGQYGDEQQSTFHWDDKKGQGLGPAKDKASLSLLGSSLCVGDWVLLDWLHEYVHIKGSSFPERPIQKLERISPEQARKKIQEALNRGA